MSRNYRIKYEALLGLPEFSCVDLAAQRGEPASGDFDVLMIGTFGFPSHPLYPTSAALPGELFNRAAKTCLILEDMHEGTFRGGLNEMCRYIDANIQYLIATYDSWELRKIRKSCPHLAALHRYPRVSGPQARQAMGRPFVRQR